MTVLLNLVLFAVLIALMVIGVALFWIARQDDSRTGKSIGVGLVVLGTFTTLYVVIGHHWL